MKSLLLLALITHPFSVDCSVPTPNGDFHSGATLAQTTNDLLVSWNGCYGNTAMVVYSPMATVSTPIGHGNLCMNGFAQGAGSGAIRFYDEKYGQAAFPFTLSEIPVGYYAQIAYRDNDSDWNFSNRIQITDTGID